MTDDFEKFIQSALKQLPDEFRLRLDNVNIFVEDFPSLAQQNKFRLREENRMLLGLYEGIPQTKRGRYGVGETMPDKITLFRQPLISIAQSSEHLISLIKGTLYHEIGHHFGLSEEELQKLEKRI